MNNPQHLPPGVIEPQPPPARRIALAIGILAVLSFAAYTFNILAGWLPWFLAILWGYTLSMAALRVIRYVLNLRHQHLVQNEQLSQEYHRTRVAELERETALANLRKAEAEALGAARDAQITTIVAGVDQAVFVRDDDMHSVWRALHLSSGQQVNGSPLRPDDQDREVWQAWLAANSKRPLPGPEKLALPSPTAENWPPGSNLLDMLPTGPSLRRIVLGVDQAGQPVVSNLDDMVHVAIGGSTGWGKSVMLCSLTYQIATAPELAALAFIDMEGMTFTPFKGSERLLFPVADTETAALAILETLWEEAERRKDLFNRLAPYAENLADFNAEADPLPRIVLGIEEATALMEDKTIERAIRRLILRVRKYGIYVLLGGQDWKSTSFDTAIRAMCSTRIQFKANDPNQSRVLIGTPEAAAITEPGRAIALLKGRERLEIQTPAVSAREIAQAMRRDRLDGPPDPAFLELVRPIVERKSAAPDARAAEKAAQAAKRAEQDAEFVRLVREVGLSRRDAAYKAYKRDYSGDVVFRGRLALGELDGPEEAA